MFLANNNQRYVAEVEAIELSTRIGLRSNRTTLETQHPRVGLSIRGLLMNVHNKRGDSESSA